MSQTTRQQYEFFRATGKVAQAGPPNTVKMLRRSPELREIQETLNASGSRYGIDDLINAYSLKDFAEIHLDGTEIHETVKVDNALFALKVADTVEKGAEYNGKVWRNLVRVFEMPQPASKFNVPKSDETLYQIHTGYASQAIRDSSGGQIQSVALDTTPASTIHYTYLLLNEDDVKSRAFNAVEAALQDAGNAIATATLRDIAMYIQTQVGITGTGTAGQYHALIGNAQVQMQAAGFYPDTFAITPAGLAALRAEQTTTGGFMPFAMNWFNYQQADDGTIGNILDMDVQEIAWAGVGTDLVYMLLIAQNKGLYLGLGEDVNVRGPEEDLLRGITEAVVQIRYAYAVANANALGQVAI
jgi:hypothetical protein